MLINNIKIWEDGEIKITSKDEVAIPRQRETDCGKKKIHKREVEGQYVNNDL